MNSQQTNQVSGFFRCLLNFFAVSKLNFVLILSIFLSAYLLFQSTASQYKPSIKTPVIEIDVKQLGLDSRQMVNFLVKPLELKLKQLHNLVDIYSVSDSEHALIRLLFQNKTPLDEALSQVNGVVNNASFEQGKDGLSLTVSHLPVNADVVMRLVLSSQHLDDGMLRLLADEMKAQLITNDGVQDIAVVGGRRQQIMINVLPEKLASYQVSLPALVEAITQANGNQKTGDIEVNNQQIQVYAGGELSNVEQLKQLLILNQAGDAVLLRDVANVVPGLEPSKKVVMQYEGAHQGADAFYQTKQAVSIAITKKENYDVAVVAKGLVTKINHLKKRLIPETAKLTIIDNQGEAVGQAIDDILWQLFFILIFIGVAAKMIWTTRIAVITVVLLSLSLSLLSIVNGVFFNTHVFYLSTLLLLLVVALTPIALMTNTFYQVYRQAKQVTIEMAIEAVIATKRLMAVATITLCGLLIPLLWLEGVAVFYSQHMVVLTVLVWFSSLLVVCLFAPHFFMRLPVLLIDESYAKQSWFERYFSKKTAQQSLSKKRIWPTLIALTLFVYFAFSQAWLALEILPQKRSHQEIVLQVTLPDGAALAKTTTLLNDMAEKIRYIPAVKTLQIYSGAHQPFYFSGLVSKDFTKTTGEIAVQLVPDLDAIDYQEVIDELRHLVAPDLQKIAGHLNVLSPQTSMVLAKQVVASVKGGQSSSRQQFSRDLTRIFQQEEPLLEVDYLMRDVYPRWQFEIDNHKANRFGVSADTVRKTLAFVMQPYQISSVLKGQAQQFSQISLQIPLAIRSQLNHLKQLPVLTNKGELIPLSELGRFTFKSSDSVIFRRNLSPVEYVTANAQFDNNLFDIRENLENRLLDYQEKNLKKIANKQWLDVLVNDELTIDWLGQWQMTLDFYQTLLASLLVVIFAVFLLIFVCFNHIKPVLLILKTTLMALLFILFGHWLYEVPFSLFSLFASLVFAMTVVFVMSALLLHLSSLYKKNKDDESVLLESCVFYGRLFFLLAMALFAVALVIDFDDAFASFGLTALFGAIFLLWFMLRALPKTLSYLDLETLKTMTHDLNGHCQKDNNNTHNVNNTKKPNTVNHKSDDEDGVLAKKTNNQKTTETSSASDTQTSTKNTVPVGADKTPKITQENSKENKTQPKEKASLKNDAKKTAQPVINTAKFLQKKDNSVFLVTKKK